MNFASAAEAEQLPDGTKLAVAEDLPPGAEENDLTVPLDALDFDDGNCPVISLV